jgi:hypothetical protein
MERKLMNSNNNLVKKVSYKTFFLLNMKCKYIYIYVLTLTWKTIHNFYVKNKVFIITNFNFGINLFVCALRFCVWRLCLIYDIVIFYLVNKTNNNSNNKNDNILHILLMKNIISKITFDDIILIIDILYFCLKYINS